MFHFGRGGDEGPRSGPLQRGALRAPSLLPKKGKGERNLTYFPLIPARNARLAGSPSDPHFSKEVVPPRKKKKYN